MDGRLGGLGLGPADVGVGVDDLAVQVGQVDDVGVDDTDGADTSGRQVEQGRRPEAAGADDQDPGGGEAFLAVPPDVGEEHVPGVPRGLGLAEGSTRLDQRIRRHALTVLLGMVRGTGRLQGTDGDP